MVASVRHAQYVVHAGSLGRGDVLVGKVGCLDVCKEMTSLADYSNILQAGSWEGSWQNPIGE